MRVLELIEAAVVGIMLVVLTVGLGVIIVGIPSFTRHVSTWAGASELSGLDEETVEETAELVRAFVMTDAGQPLPAEVAGREGFDEKTIAHLDDVRAVITQLRTATGVVAALLAAWVAWSLMKARSAAIARGLRTGAVGVGAFAVLGAVAATLDFDAVFTAFHDAFFESGTWTFSADSLIIQLFPTAFWAAAGGALALWAILGAALMVWGAREVMRSEAAGSMTRG